MDLITVTTPNQLTVKPADLNTLVGLWSRSRTEFLSWVLTRKGASNDQVRRNTRQAYAIALGQFFDGIYPKLHKAHEADKLARGEYLEPIWPEVEPWSVSATTARHFKDVLAVAGKAVKGRVTLASGKLVASEVGRAGLAEASINQKLAALSSYYTFVASLFEIPYRPNLDGLIAAGMLFPDQTGRKVLLWPHTWRNPFDAKIIGHYSLDQRPEFLTAAEVRALLGQINADTATGARDMALILTIWSTACRVSEVLNLRWGDLRPKPNGNVLFGFRGKSGKFEDVELQAGVYRVILRYLKLSGRLDSMTKTSPIFTAVNTDRAGRLGHTDLDPNAPLAYQTALQAFRKYAGRAKLDPGKSHFHALRHGRARQTTQAMKDKNGMVDIISVNRLLRHASLDMTHHYTQMFDEAEDPWAADAIAAVMPGESTAGSKQEEIARLKARLAELERGW